jgi:predicted MFS family arabinose efflux permease
MKEGMHVVFDNPILWRITACTATANLGSAIFGTVFVIFLLNTLGFSPALIGLLGTIGAIGFLIGTIATPNITKRLGLGRAIAISVGVTIINMATPLATYGYAFLILAAIGLVADVMLPIYNINQVSLRQTIVPDRLQGRMNATVRTINWGTLPIGAIIGGALGSTIGLIGTIVIGGVLQGAAVLWIMSGHVIDLKEMPKQDLAQ